MLHSKYFLNICIICVHKAHLREKMGVSPTFFFMKFLERVPVGCKSCKLSSEFPSKFQ